jgi:protein TonB
MMINTSKSVWMALAASIMLHVCVLLVLSIWSGEKRPAGKPGASLMVHVVAEGQLPKAENLAAVPVTVPSALGADERPTGEGQPSFPGSEPSSAAVAPQLIDAPVSSVGALPEEAPLLSVDSFEMGDAVPVYPQISKILGEEGKVVLRVRLGKDGEVLDVQVAVSSGFSRLDQAAVQAVWRWRSNLNQQNFSPSEWGRISVGFSLNL